MLGNFSFRTGPHVFRLIGYLKSTTSGEYPSIAYRCRSDGGFDIKESEILLINELFKNKKSLSLAFEFEHTFNNKHLQLIRGVKVKLLLLKNIIPWKSALIPGRIKSKKQLQRTNLRMSKSTFVDIESALKDIEKLNITLKTEFTSESFLYALAVYFSKRRNRNNKLTKHTLICSDSQCFDSLSLLAFDWILRKSVLKIENGKNISSLTKYFRYSRFRAVRVYLSAVEHQKQAFEIILNKKRKHIYLKLTDFRESSLPILVLFKMFKRNIEYTCISIVLENEDTQNKLLRTRRNLRYRGIQGASKFLLRSIFYPYMGNVKLNKLTCDLTYFDYLKKCKKKYLHKNKQYP